MIEQSMIRLQIFLIVKEEELIARRTHLKFSVMVDGLTVEQPIDIYLGSVNNSITIVVVVVVVPVNKPLNPNQFDFIPL